MNYYIVIPAHNEEVFLEKTLHSIKNQILQPKQVIIVNDNSTDHTEMIIDKFILSNPVFTKLNTTSSKEHLPGSKVINAFNKGCKLLDDNYDFLVKLDADLILPENYFKEVAAIFKSQSKAGIVGGFIYEKDAIGNWSLNHPMKKNHVRGAFKAYSNKCFKEIDGLKNAMGWDTIDELLAQFYGYEIITINELHVKHLRPTGNAYNKKAKFLQGKAMYMMRYGFIITLIASIKMAFVQRKLKTFFDNIKGFLIAYKESTPFLVSPREGKFIRSLRWKGIKKQLF